MKNTGAEYKFLNTCINLRAEDINSMCGIAKEVKYATLEKKVTREQLSVYFPDYYWGGDTKNNMRQTKLTLKDDYAVSFHKSKFCDIPCYYVRWSAIEYVFIQA